MEQKEFDRIKNKLLHKCCPKCNYYMQKRNLLYGNFEDDGTGEEWECCDNWCNYRPSQDKELSKELLDLLK